MSVPVTIATDSWIYSAVFDASIVHTAFVIGRVVDEVTGLPLENATVRADRESVRTRVASGGYFAVSGSVDRLFPDLAIVGYTLTLTFRADGHREHVETINIPAGTLFPIVHADVMLRPLPVRLEGRVVRESNRTGIAGATVAIKPPSNAVLLRTVAHLDHASGVNITPQTLTPLAPARSVDEAVIGGATVVQLDSVAGLAGNPILRFGLTPPEYAVVDSIDVPTRRVTLRHPLTRSYPLLAPVRAVNAVAAGAAAATTRSIDAGDGVLILAAVMNPTSIEIADGVKTEYHDANVIADADGFYAADGITGVPSLALRATAAVFQPLDRDWTIDYSRPVAALSFRLKP